jgi:eukaryotic-like serine/threonine-protein kinase
MITQQIDHILEKHDISIEKRIQIKTILEKKSVPLEPENKQTLLIEENVDTQQNEEYVIPKIGRYDDIQLIGAGAMGEVRRVFDYQLNRHLAIKIIHPKLMSNSNFRTRFVEEAQICAQLQHPNIVPVHEIGRFDDGRLYFTMKEIKGVPFEQAITDFHNSNRKSQSSMLSFRRLMNSFRGVCNAIAYAHSNGVIHRDIKPENILLGEYGEVIVVDWGIAKVLGKKDCHLESDIDIQTNRSRSNINATRLGQVAGTPTYMSPEQARGEIDKLDQKTDIYALGVVLYEILYGQPPYNGKDEFEVLEKVLSDEPIQFNKNSIKSSFPIPNEILTACKKSMSRNPDARFNSVDELSKVISDWLNGAKKREQALSIVAEAMKLSSERDTLLVQSKLLLSEAQEGLAKIPDWQDETHKSVWWQKQKLAQELLQKSQLLDVVQEHTLKGALTHKSDLEEAHIELAKRYRSKHINAEAQRDNQSLFHSQINLKKHASALRENHNIRIQFLNYLQGTGAISLSTNISNVEVSIDKFVPQFRRLTPQFLEDIGTTPILKYPVEMGSYLLRFKKSGYHEVTYPICILRGEHWDCKNPKGNETTLYIPKEHEIGIRECYIPKGWFWSGGDENAPGCFARKKRWVDSFVMSKHPVTNQEYLIFLNDLLLQGREQEALNYVPREKGGQASPEGELIYGRDHNNQFMLVPDANGILWQPDWPVCMLDWHSCNAYAKWKSVQTGYKWRLPTEWEWEKAARGVDGRYFTWGNDFDASYTCMGKSHKDKRLPVDVYQFPFDESVYGVRGMCGNMVEWTASTWIEKKGETPSPDSKLRVYRGGGWYGVEFLCRVAYRYWYEEHRRLDVLSFRLVRSI